MQSIKNAQPGDSWQYCTYSLEDLYAESDDHWIIFNEHMSIGTFESEQDAREHNDTYIEWDDVEYITIAEFKQRLVLNPELEMEPK